MRKVLICLALAASVVSVNIQAQVENAGGNDAGKEAFGGVAPPVVGAAIVGTGILAAMINNTQGQSPERPPVIIVPPPIEIPPTCNSGDELVDGVCINSTVTVTNTISGTGTNTSTATATIAVTSTYAPTN